MKILFTSTVILLGYFVSFAAPQPTPGFELRIKSFVDTIRPVDTHEHFFNPESIRKTYFLDFSLLLHQNSWDDLVSAGLPDSLYDHLFNKPTKVPDKWRMIEPYWNRSFNTQSNRVLLTAVNHLYGHESLNAGTIEKLSVKMKEVYGIEWFNHILYDVCKFDFVIQENDYLGDKSPFVRYTEKMSEWLTVRTKFRIDSLAVVQIEPIYSLDDYVKSFKWAFEKALGRGMVAAKINLSYYRTINFEDVSYEAAKKVFRLLINGNEGTELTYKEAKPLQDFLVHQLILFARANRIPVVIHTGLQAGAGNWIDNSDPVLLTNLFFKYPDVNFILYHGSYPFGGRLSVLAKNFKNVFIDMNWTYSISPTYAANYLSEWLETVPASKIMAFGGDQRCVENTYGELIFAKKIIAEVLIEKVKNGQLTEVEAKNVAKMILRENAIAIYNLK